MAPSSLLKHAAIAAAALTSFAAAVPLAKTTLLNRATGFPYGSEKVRGVNLGGWFVLEPWITPSIFEAAGDGIIDEWTLTQALGKEQAYNVLSSHWSSFITAGDFGEMAAAGLNHVRLPVGYWAFYLQDGDPYVQGQLPFIDAAVSAANAAGLNVLIDLHGAPGSQNGYDNSGHKGPIAWGTGNTVDETLSVIQNITSRYGSQVAAIELLNEPKPPGVDLSTLQGYYRNGYGDVRQGGSAAVWIHDAFQDPSGYWGSMDTDLNNLVVDHHSYQVFDDGAVAMSVDQHVSSACGSGGDLASGGHPIVVGEWSGALTDCAKYLNGRYTGSRYDGSFAGEQPSGSCAGLSSGSVSALSDQMRSNIGRFIDAQIQAYEQGAGWIFWTWRTEGAPEWDMQQLLEAHVFPNPVTSFTPVCNNNMG